MGMAWAWAGADGAADVKAAAGHHRCLGTGKDVFSQQARIDPNSKAMVTSMIHELPQSEQPQPSMQALQNLQPLVVWISSISSRLFGSFAHVDGCVRCGAAGFLHVVSS
jgi:hypothetical protein